MKQIRTMMLTGILLQALLLQWAMATENTDREVKPTTAPDIVEKCKIFEPPWGEQEWRQWWEENPEDGENWFAEVPKKMKTVDLSIIGQCTHITNMFVGFAPLKDLMAFSGMTQLKRLDMRYALDVTDLSPLKKLENLEYLNIWSTSVSDLSPLIGLDKLKTLNARMTKIVNLAPVIKMKNLKSIDLLRTPVMDISALAKSPSIEEVLLCTTGVKDLTALYPVAERFSYLDLCNTPFNDFDALKKFSNLRTLKLWGMHIENLELISSLAKLEELDLSGASFKSLKPLQRMKSLKKVWLLNTKTDPKEIAALKKAIPGLQVILELD